MGQISGRLAGSPVAVREMSLGGLAIETGFPFLPGDVHDLQLTLGDGAAVDLRARVMHCRSLADGEQEPRFLTGLQFIDEDADRPVGEIIDSIGGVRS